MGGAESKEERLKKVEKAIRSTEKKIEQASHKLIRDLHDGSGRPIDKKDQERYLRLSALRAKRDELYKESSRIHLEEQQIPGVGYEKGSSSVMSQIRSKTGKWR